MIWQLYVVKEPGHPLNPGGKSLCQKTLILSGLVSWEKVLLLIPLLVLCALVPAYLWFNIMLLNWL